MKTLKLIGLPFFAIIFFIISVPFQSCEPEDDNSDCDTCVMAYKPNIYIYPTRPSKLLVQLDFPVGGEIITSIPEYGYGWHVHVNVDGIIDSTYTFLFYESIQPDIWQRVEGWVVSQSDLAVFFKDNMEDYGFLGHEIEDFNDYWIPRSTDNAYYVIYPQTSDLIDDVIELSVSGNPDNTLRLFYVIQGFNSLPKKIKEPKIDEFKREGFFVVEWGVILD